MYLGAARFLDLPPSKVALVAAHINDLRGAAAQGMRTIYVPRPRADEGIREQVKSKAEGGEVDLVVPSLIELAKWVENNQQQQP
jgi:FMN phosphatase YigB (HAD superfamily)